MGQACLAGELIEFLFKPLTDAVRRDSPREVGSLAGGHTASTRLIRRRLSASSAHASLFTPTQSYVHTVAQHLFSQPPTRGPRPPCGALPRSHGSNGATRLAPTPQQLAVPRSYRALSALFSADILAGLSPRAHGDGSRLQLPVNAEIRRRWPWPKLLGSCPSRCVCVGGGAWAEPQRQRPLVLLSLQV